MIKLRIQTTRCFPLGMRRKRIVGMNRYIINLPIMPVNVFDIALLIAWWKKEWPFNESSFNGRNSKHHPPLS